MTKNTKVVILCGGEGTRLREETEFRPKPLVHIGNYPILYHIMRHYSYYGFKDFVLCLGYKAEMIKEYFLNYEYMANDFTLKMGKGKRIIETHENSTEDWNVTFADTGSKTLTGGRIKKIEKYIDGDTFLATYGDGVSDVDLKKLMEFHKQKGKIGTVTGVHPSSKYGTVNISSDMIVNKFVEKPKLKDIINGGFFAFDKKVFDYLDGDIMLEAKPFERLASEKQIALYKHEGFWHSMDTYKDAQDLNALWKSKKAPWKIWK